MKKIFEIEWSDEMGKDLINENFLLSRLQNYFHKKYVNKVKVKDITDDYEDICYHASLAG